MNRNNQFLSDIRLPLALLVIFCHASTGGNLDLQGVFPSNLCPVFASIFGQIAVPAFFLLSGYLFFQKLAVWSWTVYFCKLRKRVCTLLIPYVFWIILYAVFKICVMHQPVIIEGWSVLTLFGHYLPVTGVGNYWGFNNVEYGPILGPFWYIKDLMLLALCSPVFYGLYRRKVLCLITLSILVFGYLISFGSPLLPMQLTAILFFSIGAALSIHSIEINDCFVPYKRVLATLFVLGIIAIYLWRTELWCRSFVAPFFRLTAVLFVFSLARNFRLPSSIAFLSGYSFFVYAAHPFIVPFSYSTHITSLWHSPWIDMAVFFLRPLVIYLLLSAVCRMLQKIPVPGIGYLIGRR